MFNPLTRFAAASANDRSPDELANFIRFAAKKESYQGRSPEELNGAIRKFMRESFDITENMSKAEALKKMRREMEYQHKRRDYYNVIQAVATIATGELLTTQLEGFCTYDHFDTEDEAVFHYGDNSLFLVSRITHSTNDISRQRESRGRYTVRTHKYAIGTYTEAVQFATGQIDFAKWISKVGLSILNKIGTLIYSEIQGAYNGLAAEYRVGGNFDFEDLSKVARLIEAKIGRAVRILGTRSALTRLTKNIGHEWVSDQIRNEFHAEGFIRNIEGMEFQMLPDLLKPSTTSPLGTQEYVFDDNTILIVPADEKLIHVVTRGDVEIQERQGMDRLDNQIEYATQYQIGVQVAKTAVFGMGKLAA